VANLLTDIISLTKPRITLMAVLLAMAGALQSKNIFLFTSMLWSILGIGLLVSGSSVLNMYVERDLDKKMDRTKDRPLPAGRLNPLWALAFGCLLSLVSCWVFFLNNNYLTLCLGIISLFVYILCYTPLKKKSWIALLVGSMPGAMPVVLGYTSVSHVIDMKAVALFLWAYLWQIPHFLAISLFRAGIYWRWI
jgi:protoheme IX farnesyltransferase